MTLTDLLSKIEKLDQALPASPWHWGHQYQDQVRTGGELLDGEGFLIGEIDTQESLNNIIQFRAILPLLAKILKENDRLILNILQDVSTNTDLDYVQYIKNKIERSRARVAELIEGLK